MKLRASQGMCISPLITYLIIHYWFWLVPLAVRIRFGELLFQFIAKHNQFLVRRNFFTYLLERRLKNVHKPDIKNGNMVTLPRVNQKLLHNMKIKGFSGHVDITSDYLPNHFHWILIGSLSSSNFTIRTAKIDRSRINNRRIAFSIHWKKRISFW